MAGLAVGGVLEEAGDLGVALDVRDLGEVQVAAVRLRLAGERVLQVLVGLGPVECLAMIVSSQCESVRTAAAAKAAVGSFFDANREAGALCDASIVAPRRNVGGQIGDRAASVADGVVMRRRVRIEAHGRPEAERSGRARGARARRACCRRSRSSSSGTSRRSRSKSSCAVGCVRSSASSPTIAIRCGVSFSPARLSSASIVSLRLDAPRLIGADPSKNHSKLQRSAAPRTKRRVSRLTAAR